MATLMRVLFSCGTGSLLAAVLVWYFAGPMPANITNMPIDVATLLALTTLLYGAAYFLRMRKKY